MKGETITEDNVFMRDGNVLDDNVIMRLGDTWPEELRSLGSDCAATKGVRFILVFGNVGSNGYMCHGL